jgi:glyoxalase family protein
MHHLALRATHEPAQLDVRQALLATHVNVTPVLDRSYFRSIYFREPGGVILEVATDPPGFGADEPAHRLGTSLRLPSWLEGQRAAIAASLPPIGLPSGLRLP